MPLAVHSSTWPWVPQLAVGMGGGLQFTFASSAPRAAQSSPLQKWPGVIPVAGGCGATTGSSAWLGPGGGCLGLSGLKHLRAAPPCRYTGVCSAGTRGGRRRVCSGDAFLHGRAREIPAAAGLQQREVPRLDFWFVPPNFHLGMRQHLPWLLGSQQGAAGEWSLCGEGSGLRGAAAASLGWTHSHCPKGPAFTP